MEAGGRPSASALPVADQVANTRHGEGRRETRCGGNRDVGGPKQTSGEHGQALMPTTLPKPSSPTFP